MMTLVSEKAHRGHSGCWDERGQRFKLRPRSEASSATQDGGEAWMGEMSRGQDATEAGGVGMHSGGRKELLPSSQNPVDKEGSPEQWGKPWLHIPE